MQVDVPFDFWGKCSVNLLNCKLVELLAAKDNRRLYNTVDGKSSDDQGAP